ncbi:hypothetical protein C8J56DRAFT_1094049 [Mycena floridula]|nr:hypothetical protein C8J56DRAFT_1094049 [Mycena floridula]
MTCNLPLPVHPSRTPCQKPYSLSDDMVNISKYTLYRSHPRLAAKLRLAKSARRCSIAQRHDVAIREQIAQGQRQRKSCQASRSDLLSKLKSSRHKINIGRRSENRLFTRSSNFPSRTLPPLGTRPTNLDGDRVDLRYKSGDSVAVRQFMPTQQEWTSWQLGRLVSEEPIRAFAGSFAKAYWVSIYNPDTRGLDLKRYVPFLGEIFHRNLPTAAECNAKRCAADYVLAAFPFDAKLSRCSCRESKTLWIASIVITWECSDSGYQSIVVRPLVGALREPSVVQQAVPFNSETARACLRNGDHVVHPDNRLECPRAI